MPKSKLRITHRDQLIRIKNEYRAAHGNAPASPRDIADWAVAQGKYKLPASATERKCAQELADAMRTEFMSVRGGRRVRVMHSWATNQIPLWDDIRTISREHMQLALAQKRTGIVGEVKQIKRDMDYFNELHADDPPLQMSFNFTNDLADAGLLLSQSTAGAGSRVHAQLADKPAPPRRSFRKVREVPPPDAPSSN